LFRQAGLPTPTEEDTRGTWTWERFADVARQLTRREGDALRTVGFSVNLSWEGIGPFLWSAGGDYFDAGRRRCTVTDAPAIDAVQFLADLLHKHRVAPRPGEPAEGLRWFPEGTIAMQISPITSAYQWRRDPQFEFDVVLNPRGRVGQIGLLNANGYGILAGTRAQAASWEFLKHLASAETLLYLASLGRSFPWRRSVAQAREYRYAAWTYCSASPTRTARHGPSCLPGSRSRPRLTLSCARSLRASSAYARVWSVSRPRPTGCYERGEAAPRSSTSGALGLRWLSRISPYSLRLTD
ncbi:MAG: hypothetical protein C4345_15360, partial [Chloroflexota bacterium]